MKRLVIINLLLIILLSVIPTEEMTIVKVQEETEVKELVQEVFERNQTTTRCLEEERVEPVKVTNISEQGIELIKKYEGLRLTAYKQNKNEKYFTIGYGTYSSNIKEGQTITEEKAEEFLMEEVNEITKYVLEHCSYLNLTQAQADALIDFTYNCGIGNLNKLTAYGTRSIEEIAEHITAYTKSGSEENRNGLKKRREEEKKLIIESE